VDLVEDHHVRLLREAIDADGARDLRRPAQDAPAVVRVVPAEVRAGGGATARGRGLPDLPGSRNERHLAVRAEMGRDDGVVDAREDVSSHEDHLAADRKTVQTILRLA